MSEPLVTIIIPFWNNERHLNAAIQSVLGQTYAALDLVLVDDGSTDGSGRLARQHVPPARYVRRENGGAGAARNIGIEHAAAPFIAFCDADDVWAAEKLERQMASFREDPTFDVVFSSVTEFWDAGRPSPALREARARMRGALPSAMLIRREAFDRVGPFSERLRVGEWVDWYIRMRESGLKEAWLPDVLVARRLHESNNGLVQGAARTEYATILRARLHRRRGSRV
jgi:glycosyltransferase involved in cell wall biosynthesis